MGKKSYVTNFVYRIIFHTCSSLLALRILSLGYGTFTRICVLFEQERHLSFCSVQNESANFMVAVSLSGFLIFDHPSRTIPVSYTHLRAHETRHDLVCRLLLE